MACLSCLFWVCKKCRYYGDQSSRLTGETVMTPLSLLFCFEREEEEEQKKHDGIVCASTSKEKPENQREKFFLRRNCTWAVNVLRLTGDDVERKKKYLFLARVSKKSFSQPAGCTNILPRYP